MKTLAVIWMLCCCALLPAFAFDGVAPPPLDSVYLSQKPMAEWLKFYVPGFDHVLINRFGGQWSMSPAQDTLAAPLGRSIRRLDPDSRALIFDETDSLDGATRRCTGVLVHDNFRGEYRMQWLENSGLPPLLLTGDRDSLSTQLTLTGSMADPRAPGQSITVTLRLIMDNGNRHRMQWWWTLPDGKPFLQRETVYRRLLVEEVVE